MLGACTKEDLTGDEESQADDVKEYRVVLKEATDKLVRLNSVRKQPENKKSRGDQQLPRPKYPTLDCMRGELKKLALRYGPHERFPSISAGAGFRYEPKAGRFFVAEKEFKTGEYNSLSSCL